MRHVVWNAAHFANELVSLVGWLAQLYACLECGGVLDLRRLGTSPTRLTQLLIAATCVLLLCALRAARGVRRCLTRPATPTPAGCQSLAIIYLLCCASSAYLSACIACSATPTPTTNARWSLCSPTLRVALYWTLNLQAIFVVIEQFSDPRLVTCSVDVACCRRRLSHPDADSVPMINRSAFASKRDTRSETPLSETIEDVSNGSDYITIDFD